MRWTPGWVGINPVNSKKPLGMRNNRFLSGKIGKTGKTVFSRFQKHVKSLGNRSRRERE
jgi:hypothetical protein